MFFELEKGTITRGHALKMKKSESTTEDSSVLLAINWDSLTDNIVLSDNFNQFKTKLERFWSEKKSKFDPTGYQGFIV